MTLCLVVSMLAPMARNPAPLNGPVAAIFPPWWRTADVLAAAAGAGRLVRMGAVGFAVVVAPEGDRLADRLHDAGAVLLFDPVSLAAARASLHRLEITGSYEVD